MSEPSERLPDGALVLDEPVRLPEVLDALIVGGGPAGTAAAFRAKELGMAALVIDHDDLMKRIRDYAKDKPILPGFGGGDLQKFPQGGELVSQLAFEPIQKDEMCSTWKALYRRFSVPARLGIELTGLETDPEGLWLAQTWNHNSDQPEQLRARHVVFAIGRGVPRRIDIPGRVEAIARRLVDPAGYVSGPVCVIGGGTSAAEAVISISKAKKQAGESSSVYWSYRGDQMPKVSKALSDVFFEAYVGNGNIRYLPHSEPVAVWTDPDSQDFLCVRTDRKVLAERPAETTQLEFPVRSCIACIGEDLPVALLNSIGVFQVSGGPKNRQRFVVSPLMETALPNLYLAGDLLSPAYLETETPDGDPAGFREVKRRGNIKSALRDGVMVAEVIAQKLSGATRIHVQVQDAEPAPAAPLQTGVEEPVAAAPAPRLVRVLDGDTTAEEFPLQAEGVTTIGSRRCDVVFEGDTELAGRHASIHHRDGGYWLTDESGEGSVFLRPAEGRPVSVEVGAVLRAGRQWLVFAGSPGRLELVHYDAAGTEVRRHPLSEEGKLVVGREAPLTLDRNDGSLSRRHLAVTLQESGPAFTDLQSTNGTLLQVRRPTEIFDGDRILIGHQVLRLALGEEAAPSSEVQFEVPPLRERPAPAEGPTVTFGRSGTAVRVRPGQTICELAEEAGIPIQAQCHQGICGSDPVRVMAGGENLDPRGEAESDTLEELCGLEGGEYRLACLARPRGPVVVEILES